MPKTQGLIHGRLRRILTHRNSLASVLIGIIVYCAMTWARIGTRHAPIKVSDLSGPILTFTAMGFAVSTTAVALILAMPLGRVTGLMVANSRNAPPVQVQEEGGQLKAIRTDEDAQTLSSGDRDESAYLELISVFLVTAYANVASSAAVIIWAMILGGDEVFRDHSFESNILTAVVAMLVFYSGAQMLTAIRTLYQVAEIIQAVMRRSLS